jgi:tetratricopeptide (TPR) repeat protein
VRLEENFHEKLHKEDSMRYGRLLTLTICAFLATVILTLGCGNSAEQYVAKGASLYLQGQRDEAIAAYNKAIEINPKYVKAYLGRGIAYYGKGEYDKAIVDYNKAIELDPTDSQFYSNRALAYNKLGEKSKADADIKKAKELLLK